MTRGSLDISLRRLRGNLLTNAVTFIANLGISVWMTPYLVSQLGVAVYGLVPIAINLSNYMAVITVSLSGSVGRFLTTDIARADAESANRTFNTSLFASLALALLLLPVCCGVAWHGTTWLDVPSGQERNARWLLLAAALAFLTNTVGSTLAAPTFARNRLDLQRAVDLAGMLAQVACFVLLFHFYGPQLWHVGVAILAMAAVRQLGYYTAWRHVAPEIRVARSCFDWSRLREILGMGGWLTLNQAGALLFLQTEPIVINVVLGAQPAGLYAPLVQWSMLLRSLTAIASSALTPTLIAHHAWGDNEQLVSVARRAVRTLGMAIALPVGLVGGLSEPLLRVWLGAEFVHLWPLLSLITLHLCVNLAVTPLLGVNQALNKLFWPGVSLAAMGAANVAVAVWLAGTAGWGMYGVAWSGAVMLTLRNALFTTVYCAHIVKRPPTTFLRGLLPVVLGTALVAVVARGAAVALDLSTWPRLAGAALGAAAIYIPIALYVCFTRPERQALRGLLTGRQR